MLAVSDLRLGARLGAAFGLLVAALVVVALTGLLAMRSLEERTGSPVVRLNRAVAVGEADGPRAGLTALAELDPALPRHTAVAAYLHERDGDPVTAARLYAEAARSASNLAERDHLTRQAARLNAQLRR